MSTSPDESVAPSWLTESDFLERALKKYKNDESLKVQKMSLEPGSKVGDHYASVMYRLEVEVAGQKSKTPEKISLILKTMPFLEGKKMDLLKDGGLFDVEIRMYDSVLPMFKPLLAKCGIAQFWCDTVCQCHDPARLLMFEDLSKVGYTVPKGFYDADLSRRLLSSLAGLHAASYFTHHEQGHSFADFNKSIFDLPEDFMKPIFDRHVRFFIDEVTKWPGFEQYHEKLKYFESGFMQHGEAASKSIVGGYNVLIHGDFHHKNVLVKLSEDMSVVDDYKLLDYQICNWTSPALDLVYCMYMMMSPEARAQRVELVRHYHDEFSGILRTLQFTKTIPTLDDLNQEIRRFGFFEVLLMSSFVPFFYFDFNQVDDMSTLFDNDELARQPYKNDKYQKMVKEEFPKLVAEGFLDI